MSAWGSDELEVDSKDHDAARSLAQDGLQRRSRDFMPVYDDPTASIFSGPVGEGVPSSVTALRKDPRRSSIESDRESSIPRPSSSRRPSRPRSSRSSSRRRRRSDSVDARSRRSSDASDDASDDSRPVTRSTLPNPISSSSSDSDRDTSFRLFSRKKKKRRTSSHSQGQGPPSRPSFVRNAQTRRRRSSVSERPETEVNESSDTEYPEPFGPYGSSVSSESSSENEGDVSDDTEMFRKRKSSRGPVSAPFDGIGVGSGGDPVFGEARINVEMEEDGEDDLEATHPFTQNIYLPDQDLHFVFHGWGYKSYKMILWTFSCTCTLGILSLLGRWMPNLWLSGTSKRRSFQRADYIVVQTPEGDRHITPIFELNIDKPVPLSHIFPPSNGTPPKDSSSNFLPTSTSSANGNSPSTQLVSSFRCTEYRYHRFVLNPVTGKFSLFRDLNDPNRTDVKSLRKGTATPEIVLRSALFGRNEIDIKGRSIMQILFDEVLHPFYIFQVFSIILWSLDNYYYYAATILIISVSSIVTTLIETRKNIERMREMSRFTCPVDVFRDGYWGTINSSGLVPGDVIDVSKPDLESLPCDSILLSGDALLNECMLTGESVPVSKIPATNKISSLLKDATTTGEIGPELSKHVLYSGTRVIRVRKTSPGDSPMDRRPEGEALAMVFRTGFNTTKGALVRSMLFPKPIGFKFYRDSFNFIGVLAVIAGLGFLVSAINFFRMGIGSTTILLKALDLITVVVPPALPATMSIGTSFALSRLRHKSIHCISPTRINVGGKVDVAAFDKTGTLTEDGLDILGVHTIERDQKSPRHKLGQLWDDVDLIPMGRATDPKIPLLHALATCHSLKVVEGEVIGDPLDLRMFEFTNWSIEEGKGEATRPSAETSRRIEADARHGMFNVPASATSSSSKKQAKSSKVPPKPPTLVQSVVLPPGGKTFEVEDALRTSSKHAHFLELGVIRTFEFVSSLRRMSVMVKRLKSTSIEVYVKGAPEVMGEICNPESMPQGYEELLDHYTRRGYRVIALAGKSIPNLTWLKAQRMKREVVESGLQFIGLIVFENRLKDATSSIIHILRSARIGVRMCTGDNIRTAISVGRECGMVGQQTKVYMPTFYSTGEEGMEGEQDEGRSLHEREKGIHWIDVENENDALDTYTLEPIIYNENNDVISVTSSVLEEFSEYALALDGESFKWMLNNSALETIERMLVKGVIFARMSPDEKHELVERLQFIGYTVSFCGDGANDCGALRAADVGISLSEAEASVAAPFTSTVGDISCAVEVIKEGRAALTTSFSCFKYMALYSLIQFTTISLLYAIASSLGDFQFLSIDLFIIIPIAVTMGYTEAFPILSTKRPITNLVSNKVMTSLLGQIFLTSAFQFFLFFYIRFQPWYTPPKAYTGKIIITNDENTTLFLFSCWQYIIVAIIFSVGPPFRLPFYTNKSFVGVTSCLFVFAFVILFMPSEKGTVMKKVFELVELPREFRLEILLTVICNFAISWIWEEKAASYVSGQIREGAKVWRRIRNQIFSKKSDGKVYKSLEND